MVGWYHQLNGYEFEQSPGVGDGWGSWRATVHGVTESDMAEQLNKNNTAWETQKGVKTFSEIMGEN